MTKHTPGPWRQGGRLLDITAHGTTIATVNCPSQHPATEATAQANARLIAEAPAMLTALKAYLDLFNELASRDGQMAGGIAWYQMADDLAELIAEAEGQS